MKKQKLTPLISVPSDQEFWCGTRLHQQIYKNKNSTKIEYEYDYILAFANWQPDGMMMVNITEDSTKSGRVYGGIIPIDLSRGKKVVTKSELQFTLGAELDGWFLHENDVN